MKCYPCLKKAYCPGGWEIYPLEGSWRVNNESENILDCFIPLACIANYSSIDPENLKGVCRQGHEGNLCHGCLKNFGKLNNRSICYNCKDILTGAIIRFIFASLIIILYVVLGGYAYSRQRERGDGYLIVYLRIGITFTQITNLITCIKIEWPMVGLYEFQSVSSSFFSLTSEDLLFNECLLKMISVSESEIPVFILVTSITMPLILLFICSTIWVIQILMIRHKNSNQDVLEKFYIKIFASLIIAVFVLHTLILRISFNMLNCFILDSSIDSQEEFLQAYPNFRCWDSFHRNIIFCAVLPGILIWGLAFPLGLLHVLGRQIKQFKSANSKKLKLDFNSEMVGLNSNQNKAMENENGLECSKKEMIVVRRQSGAKDLTKNKKSQSKTVKIGRIQWLKELLEKSDLSRFLYEGYKQRFCFWECLIFLKKFILSLLINFIQIIGFEIVSLLILSVLSIHIYYQITKKPYLSKQLNSLELSCLLGSFTIFISVIVLQVNINASSQYLFGSIIFGAYTLCLGQTLYYVLISLKQMKFLVKIFKDFRLVPKFGSGQH